MAKATALEHSKGTEMIYDSVEDIFKMRKVNFINNFSTSFSSYSIKWFCETLSMVLSHDTMKKHIFVASFFQCCHMSSLINLFALEKLDFVMYMEARVPQQQIWSSLMLSYHKHLSFNCSAHYWGHSYFMIFEKTPLSMFSSCFPWFIYVRTDFVIALGLFLPTVGFFVYAFFFYILITMGTSH